MVIWTNGPSDAHSFGIPSANIDLEFKTYIKSKEMQSLGNGK